MLAVVSPAKTLDDPPACDDVEHTIPDLLSEPGF